MVKVTVEENCNNAPKKQFVKDFLIAAATADTEAVNDMLSENVTMEVVGRTVASEKESVLRLLVEDEARGVRELAVHNILSHGNKCAADGSLYFEDGCEVAFCSLYTFTSHSKDAKIKDIAAYRINKQPQ